MNREMTLLSNKTKHFFHVVSNIRPIVWIATYLALVPLFALLYDMLPPGEFRVPDGGAMGYGAWLYYSIVTLTTLGFGDYTPMGTGAQVLTAIEVLCGLVTIGFFLNAVGSLKSEIDVESELEKQRRVHNAAEREKLMKNIPLIMHKLNTFLGYCYAVTTPEDKRGKGDTEYDPDFRFSSMRDLYRPSGLPGDRSKRPAVVGLLACAEHTSIYLDALQSRIDLSIWPELLENCFAFVADCQIFAAGEELCERGERHVSHLGHTSVPAAAQEEEEKRLSAEIAAVDVPTADTARELAPVVELYHFIRSCGNLARNIETNLTTIANQTQN